MLRTSYEDENRSGSDARTGAGDGPAAGPPPGSGADDDRGRKRSRLSYVGVGLGLALVIGLVSWRVATQPSSSAVSAPRTTVQSTKAKQQGSTPGTSPTTIPPTGPPPAPAGFTAGQLIFNDEFAGNTLDSALWNPYITSLGAAGIPWNSNHQGGSGTQNPALVGSLDYDLPSQVVVDNGLALLAQKAPTMGVLGATPQTFPWRSGVVSTYSKFSFTGGYVQVEAKMPAGSGMWPSIWMLPGPGGTGGDETEIDLFEGGFLGDGDNPLDNFSWHLHSSTGLFGSVTDTKVNLAAGYHVYGLEWVPDKELDWYLDGVLVGRITAAQSPIPDEPMELIMNLSIANASTAHYRTAEDASTPTGAAMLVRSVQVYR
jgi:hypothetical protein